MIFLKLSQRSPLCSNPAMALYLSELKAKALSIIQGLSGSDLICDPSGASLVAQLVKNPPAMWETWVRCLGWEDSLEKGKVTHSSILAWRIPWAVQWPFCPPLLLSFFLFFPPGSLRFLGVTDHHQNHTENLCFSCSLFLFILKPIYFSYSQFPVLLLPISSFVKNYPPPLERPSNIIRFSIHP